MKKLFLAVLVISSSNVYADGVRPKPGLWEVKIVKQVMDGKDMQAQMAAARAQMEQAMANMSPEQRKQMEAMAGRQGGHGARSEGTRICISKEMAARDKPVLDRRGHCETVKFDRSGNKVSFEFKCSNNGHSETGKGETTVGAELMETVMDITMSDAHGSHAIHNESQMKFLGADCQGIKPADQQSREMQGGR